jgi:hypothetical protein
MTRTAIPPGRALQGDSPPKITRFCMKKGIDYSRRLNALSETTQSGIAATRLRHKEVAIHHRKVKWVGCNKSSKRLAVRFLVPGRRDSPCPDSLYEIVLDCKRIVGRLGFDTSFCAIPGSWNRSVPCVHLGSPAGRSNPCKQREEAIEHLRSRSSPGQSGRDDKVHVEGSRKCSADSTAQYPNFNRR